MRPYSTKVRSVGGTEMHTATPIVYDRSPPQARPAVNHSEKTTRNARSIASPMVHYARSLCHHRSLPWLTTPHHVVSSAVTAVSHPRDAHRRGISSTLHGFRFGDLAQGRFAVPNGGNETSSGRC
ncbi:hypothetical protein CPLU01_10359 [Colletotrichum plurivorum]|uniref:Uncharacterized protein n=1 Tax=Colletotrichum plurivorum TaxID=2175906 RepID=A0A8H6K6D3_9PEZI|nr:hypothetical protein CPLU01_10359 [Colletotrichum plurivorum]